MFCMTTYIMFSLTISFFLLLPLMNHPLSLGLCIMFLSLSSCFLIGLLSHSWFGFILFLIFVGGMLVMFIYVSALSPNVYFKGMNLPFVMVILVLFMLFNFIELFFLDTLSVTDVFVENFSFMKSLNGEKVVVPAYICIMIGLGVILLLNLLAVVKICYYQHGPLRKHFN
uniref:NADH dehydrogenase subunit 6 n=1 Tax=Melanodrymia galeronae TaxID=3096626 RepID=UPI002E76482F|nr:NADH dehydrogenase subunit 6 [Melanodrymia galeronae]WQA11510.1 NADH dehydrogenase subunit 6 [Melanodrymia galeronae]